MTTIANIKGFRCCTLGDVITLKRGYDLPQDQRVEGEVPVVSSSGITGRHNKAKVKSPGVVTGRYGTLGEVFYVEEDFWPLNTTLYVCNFQENHPKFISYMLRTLGLGFQNAAGAVPGVNRNVLHKIPVVIPDYPTQQRIADILSTYDRAIANNNQRIALLEESIHLLYKEWFVRLRFPGYESVKVVDGVPQGWERKTLKDIASSIRQLIHPSKTEKNTPYVGLEHIPRQSIALTSWGYSYEVNSNKFIFTQKDILFGKIRPYFHKVIFAPVNGICSSDAIVIRPLNKHLFGLTLSLVSSVAFVEYTTKTSKEGSKMPRANWDIMEQYPLLIPSQKLLLEFNKNVSQITNQITSLIFINQRLNKARDLLLPRLMNGSIAV